MEYQSFYSRNLNIEFYHATKCAMTSVRKFLNLEWVATEDLPRDRKIFAVTRDPLQRFLSGFLFLRCSKQRRKDHMYKLRPWDPERLFVDNIEQSFLNYLDEIEKNGFFDTHNIRQVDFYEGKNGAKAYRNNPKDVGKIAGRRISNITHFIRLNNLNVDMSNMLGKPVKLPKKNKGPQPLKVKLQTLLKQNDNRIRVLYLEDFNLEGVSSV